MPSEYPVISYLIIAFYIMSNGVCLLLYGLDKRAAQKRSHRINRISEKKLLWWTFISGGLCALAAQQIFRHKTQKLSFQIVALLAALCHLGIWFTLFNQ